MTADGTTEHPDPQRAFDELARVILSEHSVDSILQRIAELGQRIVSGADEVSVTLVRGDVAGTAASTGALATSLDERQYERGFGPCLVACEGGEVVSIPDLTREQRFGDWARIAFDAGARSTLTVPMPVQTPVAGAINMYARTVAAFDETDEASARALASYGGVTVSNMTLFESTQELAGQMDQAMRSRAVIEQAKGVLMAREHCTADAAFELLVAMSQRSNRKLRDVAEALLAGLADPAL